MATRGQIGCIRWLGIDQHAGHEAGKANSHHKAKGKAGDALDATIAENTRQVAAQIKAQAVLGDLAKKVRIVSAVYNLDTGKVEWVKE